MNADPPQQPNTLGNTSLVLGILGISLVFGIGLCALVGMQQGWLQVGGSALFVCGASSAFLGLLAGILGLAGLFGKNRPRAAAIAGLLLGLGSMCLFLALLNTVAK